MVDYSKLNLSEKTTQGSGDYNAQAGEPGTETAPLPSAAEEAEVEGLLKLSCDGNVGFYAEPKNRLEVYGEPWLGEEVERRLERQMNDYLEVVGTAREHFAHKNRQYGGAIDETGVLGCAVEFVGITGRIKQLVLKNPRHGRDVEEKLEEIFRDALNYAAFALMHIRNDNWEGK